MPISKFQSDVLRLLAAQRSPDSYIAGGIAINRQGPRFSADIDIFHDSNGRQESAVKADEAVLAAAGYPSPGRPTSARRNTRRPSKKAASRCSSNG